MKMRNQTIMLLIGILILFSFPAAQAEQVVDLPRELQTIGEMAFYGDTSVHKVVLHENVTEIGPYAFAYSSVKEIVIPASVTKIDETAFVGCSTVLVLAPVDSYAYNRALDCGCSVQNGDFTYRIAAYDDFASSGAFITGYTGNAQKVIIPAFFGEDRVVVIDDLAFNRNQDLTEVVFPDGLLIIGNYSFHGCSSLSKVELPPSLISLGTSAFGNCNLTQITIPPSMQVIRDEAFIGNEFTSIVIPDHVTDIGSRAFCDNKYLTTVTLPAGLQRIGVAAFDVCPRLSKCIYGSTEADWNRILIDSGNYYLTACQIEFTDGVQESKRFQWDITDGVLTVTGQGDSESYYWIGESGTSTPWDSRREEITKIIVSEGITGLDGVAFGYCINATEIVLPSTLTTIGNTVFDGCFSLTEITIPDGVTSIGASAFYDCLSLREIHIPDTVTSIGQFAFWNCPLKDIYYAGSQGQWAMISGLDSALVSPEAEMHYGVTTNFEGDFGYVIQNGECIITSYVGTDTIVTVPSEIAGYPVREISFSPLLDDGTTNTALTRITELHLPRTVERLGEGAFRDWTALRTVTGLDSVKTVGTYCFSGSGVTSLEFSAALSFAGLYAFDANDLTSITLSDSLRWPGLGEFSMTESETIFCNHQALATIRLVTTGNTPTLAMHGPALYTANMRTLVCYPCKNPLDSYIMPEGVVNSYAWAFDVRSIYDAGGLYELHVPASMGGLSYGSFYQGLRVGNPDGTIENVLLPRLVVIEDSAAHRLCQLNGDYTFFWRLADGGTLMDKIEEVRAATITDNMSDWDKAAALNEYLVDHVEYDESLSCYGAGDALIGGYATCQGYTMAYAELLNACGIQNGVIHVESLQHCFNSVYLDGAWVYVDVTWSDSTPEGDYFAMSAETVMEIYGIDPRDAAYQAKSVPK